jgi:hypothetical protein
MGESESIVASSANSVAAISCREIAAPDDRGNILPPAGWFMRMARDLWQRKVAAHLHFLLGASERTCRAWASGDSEPSASVLVALLRSDQGGRVLAFVMAGATAPWWRELRRARIVADAYDAQRQRIEQFELALE